MVESPDFTDPIHGIPVFSLYGTVRRPTDAMMDAFDVILVDLQDLGCRDLYVHDDLALRPGSGSATS